MEKLISNRCNVQSVLESYVQPPESRPGKLRVPLCKTTPVVDLERLGGDRKELIHEIMKASQEFGFFQLTNHGVSEELLHNVSTVAKEFFELPAEDKAQFYSEDPTKSCRLRTSIDYAQEKVHFWRDNLRHPCHPVEDHLQQWPQNPPRYRELVGNYSAEVRKISLWLLDLMCEGLGLESGYFREALGQGQLMSLNHYPPCPDPSLTLGMPKHSDLNLITILNQGGVLGLQVLKDEQWFAVEPLTNAFVIFIGCTLQIISNGKLKSADHRVVTNTSDARTTIVSLIHPSSDSRIEPAKALVDRCSPPLYRAFTYKDYVISFVADICDGIPPLQRYMLQP